MKIQAAHITHRTAVTILVTLVLFVLSLEGLWAYRLIGHREIVTGGLVVTAWFRDLITVCLEKIGFFNIFEM